MSRARRRVLAPRSKEAPGNCEKYIYRGQLCQKVMLLTEYIICPFLLYKNVEPVGKNGKKVCCMMTEEAKRLIRSLLKALHIFHQHGVCPGQFDESNIVLLKDGKLKFRDITFEAKDETGVLRNYQNVHLILSQLLPDNVPEDIKHLLDLMSSSRSSQMGYMIYTHASLVPLGNRFQFFLQMYEKLKSVLGRAEHQNILDAVPYGDWYKILEDNHLLNNSFHGRRTPYNINGGPTVFLNFYRNTVVHRMENHGQPLKYSYKKLRYTSDEFEEMLAVTFPLYLPKIQEVLDERKMLRALNLENLNTL